MAYENIRFRKANMAFVDGYFYMMDNDWDELVQKLDDGGISFSYPLSIDLDKHATYDEFGIDGPVNPNYWTSNVSVIGGKVRLDYAGGAGAPAKYINGSNRIILAGDFDISIDFNVILGPSTNSWNLSFQARYADGSRAFQVARSYHSGAHRYYRQYYNGSSWVDYADTGTSHTSGKLRITRSGNTLTAYYWNNGWVSLGSVSYALSVLYPYVSLGGWDGYPAATFDIDNFVSVGSVGQPVQLEHDGINFWTVQNYSGDTGILYRCWQISNNVCELKSQKAVIGNYTVNAFAVEHYHDTLSSGVVVGESLLRLADYTSTVVSGTILALGPTISGSYYEEVLVTSVSGQDVTLSSGVLYDYSSGDAVHFYNNLWVFNSYGTGSLHKIDIVTGSGLATYSDTEYDGITAATFYKVEGVFDSDVDALMYIKSTNLKFLNPTDLSSYGVMTIDNVRIDNTTVITVYDMVCYNNNVYRLQFEGTYYGTNNSWTTYNYQTSTLRHFIDSISVTAYPAILPANGVNVAEVDALVLDQYGDGSIGKPVVFTDDDLLGYLTINPAYTDYFFGTGIATTYYRAGTAVHTVTIQGTATQYD